MCLGQQSPTFLAPGTGFMEKKIFHGPEWGWGDGFRMIQTHTFIVHFISIIITSVPPHTFRH